MFWALLAKRLNGFCRANEYLSGHIQQGFLSGIVGCVEHTAMLMMVLRVVKRTNHIIIIS